MVISINAEKYFDKIQHNFMIKSLMTLGVGRIHFNIIKAMHDKPIPSMILNGRKLKQFLLCQE
jgi:hypothetical protein